MWKKVPHLIYEIGYKKCRTDIPTYIRFVMYSSWIEKEYEQEAWERRKTEREQGGEECGKATGWHGGKSSISYGMKGDVFESKERKYARKCFHIGGYDDGSLGRLFKLQTFRFWGANCGWVGVLNKDSKYYFIFPIFITYNFSAYTFKHFPVFSIFQTEYRLILAFTMYRARLQTWGRGDFRTSGALEFEHMDRFGGGVKGEGAGSPHRLGDRLKYRLNTARNVLPTFHAVLFVSSFLISFSSSFSV